MSVLGIVGMLIKLALLWFSVKLERRKELKKAKEEAFKDVVEGVKNSDPSAVTAAFDRINRLRRK